MSVTDTIEQLLSKTVHQINLGKNPKGKGYVMEVRQMVGTSNDGQTHLVHQIAGASVVDCLEQAKAQCEHATEIPLNLVRKN